MERHLTRTAVFVILEDEGKVFFLRRQNTGWADGYLTVPSGHVDKGSLVKEAAVTEVEEEAGVTVEPNDLRLVHVDYIKDYYVNFYFHAEKWSGTPMVGEPELASEGLWISPHELPEDVIPQVKNMFEKTAENKVFSEFEQDFRI